MHGLAVRPSEPGDATNPTLVQRATRIINDAYRWSEAEQFVDGKERTTGAEIARLLAASGMLLGFAGETLAGVVAVQVCAPGVAAFGMLATDPGVLRQGIGRTLVAAAEAWGRARTCREMEIEIVHADCPNAHKRLLHDWYTRLGYVRQATYPLAERIPEIAPLQRQVCVSTVYRKPL